MSKVTKWAVETAKETMNATIRVKMAKWDKAHPPKARAFSRAEVAAIAVSDPAWQKTVIARAKRGYADVDIRDSDFEAASPLVEAALKKNRLVDATRDEMREQVSAVLCERRDEITRTAIIANCETADLLKAVNEFCKY